MAFQIPNSFTAGVAIDPALTNANNTAIANKINGNMGNAEFNAGDPLALTKLAASYEIYYAQLHFPLTAGGWPAASAVAAHAIPGLSGTDANWAVQSIEWTCNNSADGAGKFKLEWGYYNAGVWTVVTTILAATFISLGAGANTGNQGYITAGMPVTLAYDAGTARTILLSSTVASAANPFGPFSVNLTLKRQIIA